MIENDKRPDGGPEPTPVVAGVEHLEAWCIVPPHLAEEDGAIGVAALRAEMVAPDGMFAAPAVEIVVPAAVIEPDGRIRLDAHVADALGRYLSYAAAVAERVTPREPR